MIGVASGNTEMSAASSTPCSAAVGPGPIGRPKTMSIDSSMSRMPPPTRTPDRLMPMIRRRSSPKSANTTRRPEATSDGPHGHAPLLFPRDIPSVSTG